MLHGNFDQPIWRQTAWVSVKQTKQKPMMLRFSLEMFYWFILLYWRFLKILILPWSIWSKGSLNNLRTRKEEERDNKNTNTCNLLLKFVKNERGKTIDKINTLCINLATTVRMVQAIKRLVLPNALNNPEPQSSKQFWASFDRSRQHSYLTFASFYASASS